MVTHTLSSEFTLLRVVNGETVAAHNLGVTNGFVKPKLGRCKHTCMYVCIYAFFYRTKLLKNGVLMAKYNLKLKHKIVNMHIKRLTLFQLLRHFTTYDFNYQVTVSLFV